MNEFFHMEPHLFPVISLVHSILLFFFILTSIPLAHSAEAELWIKECNRTYSCGKIGEIRYPFWSSDRPKFCGQEEFGLTQCKEDDYPYLEIKNQLFRVLHINATNRTMTITRADLFEGTICPPKFINVTLDGSPFRPDRNTNSLHIYYGCPFELAKKALNHFNCSINGGGELFGAFYRDKSFPSDLLPNLTSCNKTLDVLVPLNVEKELQEGKTNLADALKGGFGVDFYVNSNCSACKQSGGICGSNLSEPKQFVCLCRDKPHPLSCPKIDKNAKVPLKVGIGLGAAAAGIAGMLVIFFIRRRRNRKKYVPSSIVSRNISSDYSSMTDLEKMGSFCGVHIFTYTELEEATNNFDSSKELGDGGFGTVYHGKLRDGRVVAVKRLYENNYKRVEQFMNEVEILTRLRHQNLVSLYGCTSRHSRELLLVYEYIPNGTVADHLHGERAKPSSLPWPTRLKIAVETTSALTYLHKSDIIHRDVKTNNILLDKNFCVKVADFGLSRLFPMDVTHVSTAPQGTPGYVDPDYHQCYQLTDKSDVYSFGVVLCELISSQPAVDITRRRHEINLSNMAINKIQCQALHELVDPCLGFESDLKVNQTITAVAELAFQCLQNEKDMRPSMEDVLKRLKEIQDEAYNSEKPEEVDAPADDVVLLKSGPLPLSPDSVTHNWISRSTTPSGSG